MPDCDGVLLVDKPAGPTSHDVVQWVRWALRTRAVGHCGTLDPAATGLLIICVGAATRLAEYMSGAEKVYRASFVLGSATDSADAEGAVLERQAVSAAQAAPAGQMLSEMCGRLELPPPAVSAIRVDGERAHALARDGRAPKLEPRPMELRELTEVSEPAQLESGSVAGGQAGAAPEWALEATLRVSKGTYIRSLAVELGRRLGVPAHMGALRRLASGPKSVNEAGVVSGLVATQRERGWRLRPTGVEEREGCGELLRGRIGDPLTALPFGGRELSEGLVERLAHGQRLSGQEPELEGLMDGAQMRVALHAGTTLVVGRIERDAPRGPRIAPEKVVRWTSPAWTQNGPEA